MSLMNILVIQIYSLRCLQSCLHLVEEGAGELVRSRCPAHVSCPGFSVAYNVVRGSGDTVRTVLGQFDHSLNSECSHSLIVQT